MNAPALPALAADAHLPAQRPRAGPRGIAAADPDLPRPPAGARGPAARRAAAADTEQDHAADAAPATGDFAAALAQHLAAPPSTDAHTAAAERGPDGSRLAPSTADRPVDLAALGLPARPMPLETPNHLTRPQAQDAAAAALPGARVSLPPAPTPSTGGAPTPGALPLADAPTTADPAVMAAPHPLAARPFPPRSGAGAVAAPPAAGAPTPQAPDPAQAGPHAPEAPPPGQAPAATLSAEPAGVASLLPTAVQAAPPAAAPHPTAAPSTPPIAHLPPHPASTAWQQALGQQVVYMSQAGLHHAELQLHPLELGPLQVQLHWSQGSVSAQFSAEHAAVREAVQAALPQLRSALAEQGLSLGQTGVDADARQFRQEQRQREPTPGSDRVQPQVRNAAPLASPSVQVVRPAGLRAWA